MYKKLSIVISSIVAWLLVSIGINYSYAQTYTQEDMNKVTIRFCNQTWELKHDDLIIVEPWQDKKLRLCISNQADKPVSFAWGYAIGEYNSVASHVCGGDMWPTNRFSILIPETQERKMIISGMTEKVIEEKIVIPPGMSGLQMWCLLYKLSTPDLLSLWSMFNIELRKYGYLDIMVWWESTIKNKIAILDATGGVFSSNKKIKATVDKDNNLTLSFLMENQGNIAHNITMTGKVSNMLGFQKDITLNTTTLAPGATNEFKVSVGVLPVYKWLLSVNLNIKNDPQFLFPISDEKLKQPWYYPETGSIFIFSRIWVGVIIVLILIIYRLFVPKRTKVAPVVQWVSPVVQ